jgi:hypothetical protein
MENTPDEPEKPDFAHFYLLGAVLGLVGFVAGTIRMFSQDFPPLTACLIGFLVAMITLALVMFGFYIKSKSRRFTLHARDSGGSLLRADVRNANESILATHFTAEMPDDKYLGLLQHCLDREVRITRLVYFNSQAPKADYEWLSTFSSRSKHPSCYEQIELTCWLPFNIVIIDSQTVWLFFPSHEHDYYRNAIRIRNSSVGSMFARAFCSLKIHQRNIAPESPPMTGLERPSERT